MRAAVVPVLLGTLAGAVLLGVAGLAVSALTGGDGPLGSTMCLDSSCTYARSAMTAGEDAGAMQSPPPAARLSSDRRSAVEQLVEDLVQGLARW